MRGATGDFARLSIICPLSSLLLWSAGKCRMGLSCVRGVKSTRNHVIMYVSDSASTSIRYTESVVQSVASLSRDTRFGDAYRHGELLSCRSCCWG